MKNYKYCPYCGNRFNKHKEFFKCPICSKKVYINSSPTSSAFVIKNGKYLISKRAIEPKKGTYDPVGEFLKNGEHPEKGLLREFKEETGSSIKIIDFLGIYIGENKYKYQGDFIETLNICYIAELTKSKIEPRDDVASFHWFPINKIPNNLCDPWITKAIKDLQKWHKHNN